MSPGWKTEIWIWVQHGTFNACLQIYQIDFSCLINVTMSSFLTVFPSCDLFLLRSCSRSQRNVGNWIEIVILVSFWPAAIMLTAPDTMQEGKTRPHTLKCNTCRVSAGLRLESERPLCHSAPRYHFLHRQPVVTRWNMMTSHPTKHNAAFVNHTWVVFLPPSLNLLLLLIMSTQTPCHKNM